MQGQPLSLHFELEHGQTADLEIISAAAIAWVETLRAAAQAVDPGTDVRVDLLTVDHGSAIYNVVGEWFERHVEPQIERIFVGYERAPRSRKMLLALALFTITTAVPTYDFYFGDDFTEEDRARLKRIEKQTSQSPAVESARRKFFRTLERGRSIRAVGIKESPYSQPIVWVDNSQFAEASGLFAIEEDGAQERVTQTVLEVVLVKPALVHTPRSWTFKTGWVGGIRCGDERCQGSPSHSG